MKLQDFIVVDACIAQLQGDQRDDVVAELIDGLLQAGAAPKKLKDELVKQIIDREKHGSTGFGKGVAVPHVKHEKVRRMAAAIGVSQGGVEFNALDKAPVYSVVLLLSPKDSPDEHLQAMENIFSNLQDETFRRFLRQVTTIDDLKELIADADAQKLHG